MLGLTLIYSYRDGDMDPCENEVGFIGTVLELSGTHFNGTFWDNH